MRDKIKVANLMASSRSHTVATHISTVRNQDEGNKIIVIAKAAVVPPPPPPPPPLALTLQPTRPTHLYDDAPIHGDVPGELEQRRTHEREQPQRVLWGQAANKATINENGGVTSRRQLFLAQHDH